MVFLGTAGLISAGLSNAESAAAPVPRRSGSLLVTWNNGTVATHRFAITCYRHPRWLFLATPNIPLAVKSDGSYTDNLVPRRDRSAYVYLIVDPRGRSVHGRTLSFQGADDSSGVELEGEFSRHAFDNANGGAGTVRVSSNGSSGSLKFTQSADFPGTFTFSLTWACH